MAKKGCDSKETGPLNVQEYLHETCGVRVDVLDATTRAWLGALTKGAYTVRLAGSSRRFTEPAAAHAVEHGIWVRTLPSPFNGIVDEAWLKMALAANLADTPDVLAIAMQYTRGAPALYDRDVQIAGAAEYGRLVNGARQEGSDFNDYLGVVWHYEHGVVDHPETAQFRCLDCSGYMRMIWGFGHHLEGTACGDRVPLCLNPRPDRSAMPRRAHEIFEYGPGEIVIGREGDGDGDLSALEVGDLVFFDADRGDGERLDHVGMYLGLDDGGHQRFISSRKTHNGPTLGDYGGASVLDGSGHYARSFRAARRL